MITATIAAIDYASADLSTIKVTWSHGETQIVPATWTGFFRGATGAHIGGEEVQYIDGTGHDPDMTVLAAFVGNGGTVGEFIAPNNDA